MIVETARQFERCPLKRYAYLPPCRQYHWWQRQLFPAPSCLPMWPQGSRVVHLFPKHWDRDWDWLLAVKSGNIGTWIKNQARHAELSCVSWDSRSSGSTQKRRKKSSKEEVFPWGSPEHLKRQQTRRCRQLNCATRCCGMPATSWLKGVNKQGLLRDHYTSRCSAVPGSTRLSSQSHCSHLRADIREQVMPSFFRLFPVLPLIAVSIYNTTSCFIFRFSGSYLDLELIWELILHHI